MAQSEIDEVRALLGAKPRPVGWAERRARIDEVGSVWPVADDIELEPANIDGVPAEWSLAPGSDPSRVMMFFHGGGYCSGSIVSHRRLVTEAGRAAGMRTLAVGYRLAPEHPFPAAIDDALTAWRHLVATWHCARPHRGRRRQCRRRPDAGARAAAARCRTGVAGLPVAAVALDRSHHVGRDPRQQGRDRPAHSQAVSGRTGRCLSVVRHRSPRSARLAAVRRSARPAADA